MLQGNRRRAWVVVMLGLTVAAGSLAFARVGTVTMKDGTTFEGEVTEANGTVVVRSRQGVEFRIPRKDVASIEFREDAELEFNTRYKDLAKDDAAGRVALAKFAMDNRRPDLAKQPLMEALAIDPDNREASALYEAVRSQIEMDRRAQVRQAQGAQNPGGGPAKERTPQAAAQPESGEGAATQPEGNRRVRRPVLDADQVNFVKQAELRPGDTVSFRFENDVEKRYAEMTQRTVRALRQMPPIERFLQMKSDRMATQALLRDVKVLKDPAALAEWRTIQPRVLAGCASSGCHGGPNAGAFFLHSPADNEAATYTNFFLLATQKFPVIRADGTRALLPLIDRGSPEQSLMLQFGLSGDVARFPHPAAANFKPMYRGLDNPTYRTTLTWIRDSLTPLEPNYSSVSLPGVSSTPSAHNVGPETAPAAPAATKPATRPANPPTTRP